MTTPNTPWMDDAKALRVVESNYGYQPENSIPVRIALHIRDLARDHYEPLLAELMEWLDSHKGVARIKQLEAQLTEKDKEVEEWRVKFKNWRASSLKAESENATLRAEVERLKDAASAIDLDNVNELYARLQQSREENTRLKADVTGFRNEVIITRDKVRDEEWLSDNPPFSAPYPPTPSDEDAMGFCKWFNEGGWDYYDTTESGDLYKSKGETKYMIDLLKDYKYGSRNTNG